VKVHAINSRGSAAAAAAAPQPRPIRRTPSPPLSANSGAEGEGYDRLHSLSPDSQPEIDRPSNLSPPEASSPHTPASSLFGQGRTPLLPSPDDSDLLPLLYPVQIRAPSSAPTLVSMWTVPEDVDRDRGLTPVVLRLSSPPGQPQWTPHGIFKNIIAHIASRQLFSLAPYHISRHLQRAAEYTLHFNHQWIMQKFLAACPQRLVNPQNDTSVTLHWYVPEDMETASPIPTSSSSTPRFQWLSFSVPSLTWN